MSRIINFVISVWANTKKYAKKGWKNPNFPKNLRYVKNWPKLRLQPKFGVARIFLKFFFMTPDFDNEWSERVNMIAIIGFFEQLYHLNMATHA